MEKDTIELRKLYEQVLILEDSELSKYGFSREFIKALFSKFSLPHDSKFVKLNKMPMKAEFDNYFVVIAKLKGKEEGVAILDDNYIYELKGKEFTGSKLDFTNVKSAVDKNTIYGVVEEEKHKEITNREREAAKAKTWMPLTYEILKLLQTKFATKFFEKINRLQEYIYDNIKNFKHTPTVNRGRWSNNEADISRVIDVLVNLSKLKESMLKHAGGDADSYSTYTGVCTSVIRDFLAPYNLKDPGVENWREYKAFVELFNKQPSFTNLAKLFLTALDKFEDEVLYYIHADYFKDIPWEQQEQKLKELKQREIDDAAYSNIELSDLYNL